MFADAVLLLHFAVVVFVVGGLVLIVAGSIRGWHWVNGLWFRLAHLGAIAVVAVESWLGITCPLTTFEIWLRGKAGAEQYNINFMEYWLQRLLFYDAPPWAFIVGYSVFCMLVIATWWYFPPMSKNHSNEDRS
jgi:hypothetical protein